MYKTIFYTHLVSVNLFLLIYLVKTVLLLANKDESLMRVTRVLKVPEMIVSFLFLATGIYMLIEVPVITTMQIIKIVAVFASIPLAVVGFKKKKKALALIAFLLIVAAYGLAEMNKKKLISGNAEVKAGTTEGHEIFTANCERCHGADGKLGLMDSPDLSASVMTQEERMELIRNGKGVMAPFGKVLSEEQIRAVAAYTETLKK